MISYLADVYRGDVTACDNPAKLLLYFSFFPQVIQGPIPRYGDLYVQLVSCEHYDSKKVDLGIMGILYGFFLKLMIADKAKIVVDAVFAGWRNYGGLICWETAVLYSIQLYADFKAYVEISKGVSCFLGINLSPNFDRPYSSASVKEFWRRWHVSLGLWLRDYIYFPLGGSKKGKVRKWGNILFVFLLSGFWHGGGGQFMIWGLMHGIYQIVEDIFGTDKYKNRVCLFLKRCITFIFVTIAWVMFRADGAEQGIGILSHMIALHRDVNLDVAFWELGLSAKQWGILIVSISFWVGSENPQIQNWLKEALRYQNPTVVIFEVYNMIPYGYSRQEDNMWNSTEAQIRQAVDYMKWSQVKLECVWELCRKDKTMRLNSFIFPMIRHHDRWEELGEEDFDFRYFDRLKIRKGYKLVTEKAADIRYTPLNVERRDDIEEMDVLLTKYVDGIVELCREKNMKLIFVRTPYLGASEEEYLQIKKYALMNNVDYYDLNQEKHYRKMNYDI